jgi:hypothetical protein
VDKLPFAGTTPVPAGSAPSNHKVQFEIEVGVKTYADLPKDILFQEQNIPIHKTQTTEQQKHMDGHQVRMLEAPISTPNILQSSADLHQITER